MTAQLRQSPWDKVTAKLCYVFSKVLARGLSTEGLGKGGGREQIRESEWFGESIGLARNGGGAVCHSWRDSAVLLLWVYFPLSFLSMVFLLIISLESNEKLYLKVLLFF